MSYAAIDTISESGLYQVTDTVGTLLHLYWDINYSFQLFHRYGTDNLEFRYKRSNVWGNWFILCTTKIESIAIANWCVLYKSSNIVTVRILTVRTAGIAKDQKYTLDESIPTGYRPPSTFKVPVRFRAGNFLSNYGDGVMEFYSDGTILLYGNQDIPIDGSFEIDGCASWPAAS